MVHRRYSSFVPVGGKKGGVGGELFLSHLSGCMTPRNKGSREEKEKRKEKEGDFFAGNLRRGERGRKGAGCFSGGVFACSLPPRIKAQQEFSHK